ncbi:MAG: guanylate kinase [Flavobacteriales bacterium]|jgi:guanylate kinase|nr:guanylate kinase [Flavobacteriales bacterium]
MKGKAIIVSAPSGAGKTTIVRHLMDRGLGLAFSVSATTRPMRSSERDGHDYWFLSEEEFKRRITAGDFVEWEEVYPGRFYGTLREEVLRIQGEGRYPVFDVDVEGGLNLKKEFGDDALALFIAPPSLQALEQRLNARGTETPESLAKRVGKAAHELTYAPRFDRTVVNDDLNGACAEAEALVRQFLAA